MSFSIRDAVQSEKQQTVLPRVLMNCKQSIDCTKDESWTYAKDGNWTCFTTKQK